MHDVREERNAFRWATWALWIMFGVATCGTAWAYVISAVQGNPSHAITALVSMVPDALLLAGAIFMTDRAAVLDGRRQAITLIQHQ